MDLYSRSYLTTYEVVRFIRDLGRKQDSTQLMQLASRITSAVRLAGGESQTDVFAKVKGLISDLIARLEAEAEKDADKQAWCEKTTAEMTSQKEKQTALVEKLKTKIDQLQSTSGQLKEEVARLQEELRALASSQAEMDKMRNEEKATFASNQADLEQGISGVRLALKVLTEYYNKNEEGSSQGAATGIIALLEVVESDFSKSLAEMNAAEAAAQRDYDVQTKENNAAKLIKEQDVKYKSKEAIEADHDVVQLTSDLENTQEQLDAIIEGLKKIDEQCIGKAEAFEERKRRREAEIAGLKEALDILENETVLLQRKERRSKRALRGEGRFIAPSRA
eukprot:gnl/TRDRNA2_/TRDRNA2_85702_c1_seq1.p1 gnl/TRDRNA2_/TRDRNA2_85702_c1~~gnl/TRDRNA2_/TRDRNA2_85702_c1_seq1.p1  ORF type:complete len:336 (+),score=106.70 gnl/TRDRNA2_/TRDRNA2_85702_c1_seq1:3-1010(+)